MFRFPIALPIWMQLRFMYFGTLISLFLVEKQSPLWGLPVLVKPPLPTCCHDSTIAPRARYSSTIFLFVVSTLTHFVPLRLLCHRIVCYLMILWRQISLLDERMSVSRLFVKRPKLRMPTNLSINCHKAMIRPLETAVLHCREGSGNASVLPVQCSKIPPCSFLMKLRPLSMLNRNMPCSKQIGRASCRERV